jgi:hypothetical protein
MVPRRRKRRGRGEGWEIGVVELRFERAECEELAIGLGHVSTLK